MKKKLFSILLSLAMVVTMMPMATFVASADSSQAGEPLCFTAEQAGSTVSLSNGTRTPVDLEYSENGGAFTDYTFGTPITLSSDGDNVRMRSKHATDNPFEYDEEGSNYQFTMEGKIKATGDITTLINKNGTDEAKGLHFLFDGCTALTSASIFPETVTKVGGKGCQGMFRGCTGLTTAPNLHFVELGPDCCKAMFTGCTNLIEAPELPATELQEACYGQMFRECSNLIEAPILPAKVLENYCYQGMFYGCSNLNKITVNFTSWNGAVQATKDWVNTVSSDGTFVCPNSLPTASADVDHIPTGWTTIETFNQDNLAATMTVAPVNVEVSATATITPVVNNGSGGAAELTDLLAYSMSTADATKIAVESNTNGTITIKGLSEGAATLHLWNKMNPEASANCAITVSEGGGEDPQDIPHYYPGVQEDEMPAEPTVEKPKVGTISASTGSFTIKFKKLSKKKADGYQIKYSVKKSLKNSKTKNVKNTGKKLSKKIINLKAKQKYYVKVRSYKVVNGKIKYSKWSKLKSIKTR